MKSDAEYLEEIKKLIEEYEKKFSELAHPTERELAPHKYTGVGFHDYDLCTCKGICICGLEMPRF